MFKSSRNGGIVNNRDMITQLPEALLLHIFSFIPTKIVVSTSVLSKQWKSLCKLVPKLEFDYQNNQSENETFSQIVCKILLSHKAPVIESLIMEFSLESCNDIDIGMWIGIAYARHVREIVFHVVSEKGVITLPRALYNCETIESLKLSAYIRVDVRFQACLKSLRTLHLYNVDYENDDSVRNLLDGCPNLQELVVYRDLQDVEIFSIGVPSLQRLTIYDENDGEGWRGYAIDAPSLKYLKLQGFKSLEFCIIENVPNLEEAHIINVSNIIDENILGALTSVKRLYLALSPLEITFPTGSVFNQLVYLELFTHKAEWLNLLLLMLDSAPTLQSLKLVNQSLSHPWRPDIYGAARVKWSQPKSVPKCLLLHLETFVWKGYKQGLKEQREAAKYILKNTNRLKKATFFTEPYQDFFYQEMVKDFKSVDKASISCELVYKFSTD
ncbi:unnamed protein product [Cochlearia groenlandica]